MKVGKLLIVSVILFVTVVALRVFYHPSLPVSAAVHVQCETTKGPLEITVIPEWSPQGAARFLELVDDGFFNNLPLFRCMAKFVCQAGAALPRPGSKSYSPIQDDPPLPAMRNFQPGYISFAGFGTNSRNTHIFIALDAVPSLGAQPWETPFGYVKKDNMESTVAHFNTSYGESAPTGKGPEAGRIEAPGGDEYLRKNFPDLDYFVACSRKR